MAKTVNHKDRGHALLSASSAHRWLTCPPSALAAELYPAQDTDYTREGTEAHEVAEQIANGRPVDEGKHPKEMIENAEAYRDYIQEHTRSPLSLKLLEQRVDFSPWVPDGFGTCDCIIIEDDLLTVIDYKYGIGVPVSAEKNPQMMLYALGALNDYGFAYDVDQIEMHIFQPRIDNISVDRISVTDLLAWADGTVKPTAALAAEGKGEYLPGAHCKFCPHAGKCRELAKVCTDFVTRNRQKVPVEKLAPHEISEILSTAPMIETWLKRVQDTALTGMLNGETVPGYKVVAGRASRAWKDDLCVSEELQRQGFSREDITKTELLSVAAMEKAIGKKKVAELVGALIDTKTGNPTIAPETDKRPAYNREEEIKKDFE